MLTQETQLSFLLSQYILSSALHYEHGTTSDSR